MRPFVLYPQLPLAVASELAEARSCLEVVDLRALSASSHELQTFSATGGHQCSRLELEALAEKIRTLCDSCEPNEVDAPLARLVHSALSLSRREACSDGVWSFFSCVLVPDVVRWRFPGSPTAADRFVGAQRGVRTLVGRAWWRAELLHDSSPPLGRDSLWLLDELTEDEVLGLVERPRAVASRRVAVALARALVEVKAGDLQRGLVAREAIKTFLRLGYFVDFDAMSDEELRVACQSQYRRALMALRDA